MVYENCKIYGPYKRCDNRLHVCVIYPNGKRSTVSYPKYLMEIYLNRYLEKDESVDHIDCNFSNNEITNLRVLKRVDHARLDAIRVNSIETTCVWCGKDFVIPSGKLHNRGTKQKAGPFCSKRCVGLYGKYVQTEREKFLPLGKLKRTYYTLKEKENG